MHFFEQPAVRGGLAMLLLLSTAGGAHAEDSFDSASHAEARSLRGVYGASLTQSCIRTPYQPPPAVGFDQASHQLLVEGELVVGTGTGVLRFAKDGVVTLESGLLTEMSESLLAAGQTPVSPGSEFICDGTYASQPGGKVAVTLACEILTGQPGRRVTLGPLKFDGFVAEGKRSINLSTPRREVHTVTIADNGTAVLQRERSCLYTWTLDKVQ